MSIRLAAAALLAAGCATARASSGELPSDRGVATSTSLECARTVLEQRGYRVETPSRQPRVRGEKTFSSRGDDVLIHIILTARLEPSAARRTMLRVLTTRRVGTASPDARRDPGRLFPSAFFEAAHVDEDVRAIVGECTG